VIGLAFDKPERARWVDSAVRYKVWRSNRDKELHLLCGEGAGAFNALPTLVRNLGPWTGSKEGDIDRLRLPLRVLLAEQGFVVVHCHVSNLQLENVAGMHPANVDCPECKGTGHVPIHGGLRQKNCPNCSGRGWIRGTPAR
jgi:hypothetical protein